MDQKLMGVFAPISTPFTATGEVDYEGLKKNLAIYPKSGIKGYLALGSNGENKSLTNDEKLKVLETIMTYKAPDQVVMAGCIFESTFETIEMAKKMEEFKPDFLTLLPPNYFKSQMTDDVLYTYFTDVADAVSTPCLLYNAPKFAGGVGLSLSLVKRCAEHPNIVGLKDSTVGNIEKFLFALRDSFNVMSGTINNFFNAMIFGAAGGVLSLSNSFPEITMDLYNLLIAKDYEKAIALYDRILQINNVVGGKGGVSAVKYAMDLHGLVGGYARRPLMPISDAEKKVIHDKLQAEGLIKE